MTQALREGNGLSATKTPRRRSRPSKPPKVDAPKAQDGANDEARGGGEGYSYSAHEEKPAPIVDPGTLEFILSMTREIKKMSQKAGLMRVALILEMAELEAMDQGGHARR